MGWVVRLFAWHFVLKKLDNEEEGFAYCAFAGRHFHSSGFGVVGSHGVGTSDERGKKLLQFCVEYQLVLANTFFQQHNRRLYTGKLCDDHICNQIDHVPI